MNIIKKELENEILKEYKKDNELVIDCIIDSLGYTFEDIEEIGVVDILDTLSIRQLRELLEFIKEEEIE